MTDRPDFENFSLLIKQFAPAGKLVQVAALHGGLSTQAMVLSVMVTPEIERKFVVRRPPPWMLSKYPDIAAVEYRLLQFLISAGLRVQKPVYLDADGTYLGSPSLTLEYVTAATDFLPDNLESSIDQMAAQMAEIHGLNVAEISKFLPVRDISISAKKEGVVYSEAEEKARNFLATNWPRSSRNRPVLVHGDYWPGNILWDAGTLSAVLDWEQAGICDPLYDLAITQLDVLWLFGPEAMELFVHRYSELTEIDKSDLPYWNLRAALRTNGQFAKWASVYPGLGRPDVTETSMRERHHYFVGRALEQIEGAS